MEEDAFDDEFEFEEDDGDEEEEDEEDLEVLLPRASATQSSSRSRSRSTTMSGSKSLHSPPDTEDPSKLTAVNLQILRNLWLPDVEILNLKVCYANK